MKKSPFSALLTGAAFALLSATSAFCGITSFVGNTLRIYTNTAPTMKVWSTTCNENIHRIGNSNWWEVPFTSGSGCNYGQWAEPTLTFGKISYDVSYDNTWPSQGSIAYVYTDWQGNLVKNGTEEPKSLYAYNPWPYSKPSLVVNGGAPKEMFDVGEEHCGWYRAFFPSDPIR